MRNVRQMTIPNRPGRYVHISPSRVRISLYCPSSRESCVKTPVSACLGSLPSPGCGEKGSVAGLCRRKEEGSLPSPRSGEKGSVAVLCRRKEEGSLPSPRSGEKGSVAVLCRRKEEGFSAITVKTWGSSPFSGRLEATFEAGAGTQSLETKSEIGDRSCLLAPPRISPEFYRTTAGPPLDTDVLSDHHLRPDVLLVHHVRLDVLLDDHLRPDILPNHHLTPDVLLDHHLRPDVLLDHHLTSDVLPDYRLRSYLRRTTA
ncbi:hypothetical protein M5K25_013466 [Dendrobium thyrsiflorum]|uniref:Uncharacterized protein n=1 Tax=Dendrobium thyrsiflorum TaxID=117978 RepID=A0ABD0UTB8_DENTH